MLHSHSHNGHEHCHHNNERKGEKNNQFKLGIILVLTILYMVAEFVGGWYTNSLALVADAGHMLSDVGAFVLSLFAIWISLKPATPEKTYGYYRTEILAAFINGIALVGISVFIIYEAYLRLFSPPEIKAPVMIIIATGGFVINLIGALLLHNSTMKT